MISVIVVEFGVLEELLDGRRGLERGLSVTEGLRVEGKVTVGKHLAREGLGHGLDAQVTQHGVGLPAAKEHDGVFIDIGTEECGGASGS